MQPTTIRMAPWVIGAISLAAFALAAAADAAGSKIVLDGDTMQVVSLMRRRSFSRSEFVSAQVDGGAVVLKRKAGGWVILPGTGQQALSVRNTIHTWITHPRG